MSIDPESGRLRCTISGTEFGPDFGSHDAACEFLAFVGYYPEDWRQRTSFSVVTANDPRQLGPAALGEAVDRFLAQGGGVKRRPLDLWLPDHLLTRLGELADEAGVDTAVAAERLLTVGARLFSGFVSDTGFDLALSATAEDATAASITALSSEADAP